MSIVTFWSPSALAVPKEKGISSTPAVEPLVDVIAAFSWLARLSRSELLKAENALPNNLFQVALDLPADFCLPVTSCSAAAILPKLSIVTVDKFSVELPAADSE